MYKHTQLSKGEIRLIKLRSPVEDSDDSPLECDISIVPLKNCPKYNALSYCWGADTPTHPLTVGGQQILVRDNLFSFLREVLLRRRRSAKQHDLYGESDGTIPRLDNVQEDEQVQYLWTDAICINQEDDEEKSAQLRLMRDIYASASYIIIWLGEEMDGSSTAFKAWMLCSGRASPGEDPGNTLPSPEIALSPEHYQCLSALRKRKYWFRVWVLQEASTPGVPKIIWCGQDSVALRDAAVANEHTLDLAQAQRIPASGLNPWIHQLDSLIRMEEARTSGKDIRQSSSLGRGPSIKSLMDLLNETRELEATDPRDKMYALFPIYSDLYPGGVQPQVDYTKTPEDVLKDVVVHILLEERNPQALLFCTNRPPDSACSWVLQLKDLRHSILAHWQAVFRVSGETEVKLSINEEQTLITFRGIRLDTIRKVHRPLTSLGDLDGSETSTISREAIQAWFTALAAFFFGGHEEQMYIRGGSLPEAVDRLLSLDQVPGFGLRGRGEVTHWPLRETVAGGGLASPMWQFRHSDVDDLLIRTGPLSPFWTASGLVGAGEGQPSAGDSIVACLGLSLPLVLRPHAGSYRVVGPCYVQGIMYGEGIEDGVAEDFVIS